MLSLKRQQFNRKQRKLQPLKRHLQQLYPDQPYCSTDIHDVLNSPILNFMVGFGDLRMDLSLEKTAQVRAILFQWT